MTKTLTPRAIGRAVAIAIATAAPLVMASAQARVIYDRVIMVHPAWPVWTAGAMAVGFELCILTCGLAVVVTGHGWRLLVGEVFLLGMSVAVAVTGAFGLPPWVLVITIALVPLQYAVAFYAAHALYVHWYGQEDTPADVAAPIIAAALGPAVQVNGHAPAPAAPKARTPHPARQDRPGRLTPELYRQIAAEHVPDGTGALEADSIVARVARVSPKTAQRARLAA